MKVITFGRSHENDVCINDSSVSRYHCQIVQNNKGSYIIKDLNSSNGTYVNGRRISGAVELSVKDSVRIGKVSLPWNNYFDSNLGYIKEGESLSNNSNVSSFIFVLVGIVVVVIFAFVWLLSRGNNDTSTDDTWRYENGVRTNVPSSILTNEKDVVGNISGLKEKKTSDVINITGMWSCKSKETIVNDFGEELPSWTFDLKLEVINNQIRGDYLVVFPDLRTDGNMGIFSDEDNFDIEGLWDGEKYLVKYHSSWEADVIAYIKPINSQKIEWSIISVEGSCSFAPEKAILTKDMLVRDKNLEGYLPSQKYSPNNQKTTSTSNQQYSSQNNTINSQPPETKISNIRAIYGSSKGVWRFDFTNYGTFRDHKYTVDNYGRLIHDKGYESGTYYVTEDDRGVVRVYLRYESGRKKTGIIRYSSRSSTFSIDGKSWEQME